MRKLILLFLLISIPLFSFCSADKEIPRVPEWAKEAVWYQIFPERFNNGDTSNDPTPKDLAGGWPYSVPDNWQVHPWTSDWYKLQPWEEADGHDFYWNSGVRRYGGDLQGVIDKLDYLQDLGITAIYFNPLFESPSLHKYDAKMYHHIDNNYGPDPKGDEEIWASEIPGDPETWQWTSADKLFLKLIHECHQRNIKIIIDGVFNHVGNTYWAFQDVVKNQQDSKFKDWFTIHSWDDPATEENEFDYEGWFGVKDLPEIKEDSTGLVPSAADHVHAIVMRWMDPNNDGNPEDGIDGWRLDVADMVNINFWKSFRSWVKNINPQAYLTGEIWWEDWPNNVMIAAEPWLQGDTFDAVMNYRFTRAVQNLVIDQETQITPQGFIDSLANIASEYNIENRYVLMNLMGSHDAERLASLIVNPDHWYDHNAHPGQRNDFDVRKPNEIERMRQKLAVGIQMTMLGAPMVYYGDEAGMWGGDDPDCRKPMVWPELEYETETTHPFGKKRELDEVKFDQDLFNWYKLLIGIRKENKPLSLGDLKFFHVDNENKVLGYKRSYLGKNVSVLLNNNNRPIEISISAEELINQFRSEFITDLITGNEIALEQNEFKLIMKPYQILVLK